MQSGSITYSGQTIEKKFGGGLYNYSSSPTLTNLTISGNAASHAGGGLYNYSSSPTLTNVTISGNTAGSYNGGGLYNYSSSPTLTNVTISGNTAISGGGGIFNFNGSSPTITNTIFWGNKTGSSTPTTNVAGADIKNASSSTAIITYSLVQLASSSYTSGNNNLLTTNTNMVYATDPSFNDASDPDGTDDIWMTADDGLNIINSPAYGVGKSSGAPSTDITGASRASSPSMGAYEGFITRYYVDIDATGTGAGTSWTNAYTGLQDAIDASSVGDEIWVAEGTYIPNVIPQFQFTSTDNRNKTFAINKNIAIYGGFDGTESVLSQRDAKLNITVLSGDLGTIGTVTDNCYHVVMTANLNSTAIIDGFTIQDGNANGGNYTNQYGGRNFARELGGGIANNFSSPTLSNLIIKNNRAKIGAGVSNSASSSYLINLTFVDNIATEKGGGVANIATGSPSIINCVFSGNLADDFGGGIYSEDSPTITNCTFFNNKATTTSKGGGGVYAINAGTTTVSNCIFFGNKIGSSTTNVGSDIKNGTGHTTTVDYSMVQLASGSYTSGNTNALTSATNMVYNQDPLFSGHGGPDGVDNVWMTEDDGLRLNSNSPAVDAGLNSAISGYSTDIVGTARVVNTNVNMGAYEVLCSETTETITANVCDSYTSPSGKTWTTSNTYMDTIANDAGCDSVITVNLTVRDKTTETITANVCDSYTSPSGKTWTTSNTYSDTIPNTAGCDSVITVNLTVRDKTTETITANVCDSYTSPSGKTWTTSNTYSDTIANTAGCDSVITVNLTVRDKTTETITANVCDSYTSPSGKTWTTSNTYSDTIANTAGCDSVITVNLTVRDKTTETITANVCDSYTSPSGKTWTTSNTYMDTIANDAGCDSVITVNLTVRYKTTETITANVCDSYTSPSGKTWTTSSTYMDTIPNDAGCDSVITVNLTVRNKSFGSLTANVCDSFLSPSGKTWTTSSTYLDTIANTAGCDSVITVNLTVRYKSFATISPDVCDSFLSPSGKTWTTTNTYLDTIPNDANCDSIITVNLTVRYKSFATISDDVCDSYTSPSGKTWTTTNTYLDTIPNDAGCDSVITVNLTVRYKSSFSFAETVYETFTSPSGKTWTNSGTYLDTIPNDVNCDSIITVDLTVINKLFVDTDGSSGTGKSWGTSMKTLDDAIKVANATGNHAEIWVRKGMYYPGGQSSSNRDSAFLITNPNVELLGGFSGTETEPGQRNQTANPTILCGDIGTTNDSSDNAYHVLIIAPNGSDIGPNFKLDGLTFKNGNADGSTKYTYGSRDVYQTDGGAITIMGSGTTGQEISPTITNCHFEGNYGDYGSIYIRVPNGKSFATISHCTFKNNHSIYGAIFNDGQAGEVSPNIVNCAFDGNTSATSGAAIYNYGYGGKCSPTITSCVFNSNSASSMGGAIYNTGYGGTSNPVITNATFHANAAGSHAGAMYSFGNSGTCQPKVTNSIFYKNTKGGDDDHKFSEFYNYAAYPYIKNSSMQRASSTYTASTFNSLNSGTNNIFQTNPNFEAIADGNGADDVWRTGDDGLRLSSSSTNLLNGGTNTGAPTADILGNQRMGTTDMGAYEYVNCGLNVKLATSVTTHTATQSVVDGNFVCYCNSDNELLLALDTNGTGAVITPSQVKLYIGNPSTLSYNSAGGMITNTAGGVILERRWDVEPTTQPTSPVTVRYFYTNDNYGDIVTAMAGLTSPTTITSPSQLQFYKVTGGSSATFPNPHDTGVTGIVLTNGTTASTTVWVNGTHGVQDHTAEYLVSTFSGGGGGGGGGSSPLPVELIQFEASPAASHTADLTWKTASELNNSHFVVERSYDGRDFQAAAIVQGNGTTQNVITYNHNDNTIDLAQNTVFYRLRQVDFDGTTAYSPVRRVDFEGSIIPNSVTLYPNPTKGTVTVSFTDDEAESHAIKVIDNLGRELYKQTFDGQAIELDLSSQATGIYFIILDSGESFKVIKQ